MWDEHSRTSDVNEANIADLKVVVELAAMTPVPHVQHLHVLAHVW
jgi:hypothetical protein